jgi:3'-phosphoadenosine 5'-phosphosulfate sulfotransferase (PAPS reductase)/FAD synthetase
MLATLGFIDVPILFGDTGYHFPETLHTLEALAKRYPLKFMTFAPKRRPTSRTNALPRALALPRWLRVVLPLRKVQPC